ncbi:MAG: FAD-dependent oxidoreductase [Actinobacteria bacterium]|nr:FAD-dependent oxidoreductase [Actinomycetota bacterium]
MGYRTILVGTDGSPTANVAQRAAVGLARDLGARLVLACAYDPPRIMKPMAEAFLEYAEGMARREGIEVEAVLDRGEPAEVLAFSAERMGVDLIVVGNRGMGSPSRFRLGSVPERVAHTAPCDVLIVDTTREGEVGGPGEREYDLFVAGTDGSGTATEACRVAFELAMQVGARVLLAYVGDPLVGAIRLEETLAGKPRGVRVATRSLVGDPAAEIVRLAADERADLVVVGNKGMSGARRFLGSVPNKVAHQSPTDVLIVRTADRSAADLQPGHGGIVELGGRRLAVFKGEDGALVALDPKCTHMGCTVDWNQTERTWDCPCHGSRFAVDGAVIQGPAKRSLEPADGRPGPAPAEEERVPATAEPAPPPAPRSAERIVVVGAGLTGASAAVALREEGFDGPVLLIGAEPLYPYERPPLSKAFLRGEASADDALVQPPSYWKDHAIDLMLGATVLSIDPAGRRVAVGGGEEVPYDKLLLATGARNRRFPIPGLDLPGIHGLRTLEDAARIRAEMAPGRRAVVAGAGFIGSEVAASLRARGVEVTVIDGGSVPLERVLGPEVGGVLAGIHRDHGVEFVFGDRVAGFEGDGRVERVLTAGGGSLSCDFVIMGVGVQPNVEEAQAAGLDVDNGVLVDELCRTSAEGIWAAGDVANHQHPVFGRVRTEHWQNAIRHGRAAARAMVGKGSPYDEVHWFWSDQYDQNLQYAGFHTGWDDLVIRGSLEERSFLAFYVQGGKVRAAVALNRGQELREAMDLIGSGAPLQAAER